MQNTSFVSMLALVSCSAFACGGGGGEAKSPTNATDKPAEPSIGAEAVAQGGLAGLDSSGGDSSSGGAGTASGAATGALQLDHLESPVKMDGVPREWPGRIQASEAIRPGADATFATALQYDENNIYVAGEVNDANFVPGQDHASLTLAVPVGGALHAYEIALYAGKPGETAGSVKFGAGKEKGREVPGAKIVEAPAGSGYTFEATIPWTTFPEARVTRIGLRGTMRYYDGSDAKGGVLATGPGDVSNPTALPSLPTPAEQALIEGFLQKKGLSHEAPKFEVLADIAGDGLKERVAVYGRYLTVCGPGYRNGTQFFVRDLGGELVRLEARELTTKGKDDLIVDRRVARLGNTREHFEVWSFKSDEPATVFAHEVGVIGPAGKRLSNRVHLAGKDIEISIEKAEGWDIGSYHEAIPSDVEPILFPWGGVRSHVFRYDGSKFAKVKEDTKEPEKGPIEKGTTPVVATRPVEPPTPEVTKAPVDLSRSLFDLYKKERGVSEAPKVDLQVNVAEDAKPERVILIGRDVLVFGPGFKGGTSYAYLTLQQFDAAADIKEMTARDLTGDGPAEVIVRGTRHMSASGQKVDSEMTFVYEVKSGNLMRIFSIETARESSGKRVQGSMQFVPAASGKGFDVLAMPGKASGWTDKTYPWGQDKPGGSVEPLLLPWGGVKSLRYTFNGTQFVTGG